MFIQSLNSDENGINQSVKFSFESGHDAKHSTELYNMYTIVLSDVILLLVFYIITDLAHVI